MSRMFAVPVVARPARTVSMMTAMKSSTTKMPTMSLPCMVSSLPESRSIFIKMAELLTERLAPKKIPSVLLQPIRMASS